MAEDVDGAGVHFAKAVELEPGSAQYRLNLARVLASIGRFSGALPHMEEAVKVSGGREPSILGMLAALYAETGRLAEAVATARRALGIAIQARDDRMIQELKASLARYEALAPPSGKP
jgi:Flp pilus assembly protein TadD